MTIGWKIKCENCQEEKIPLAVKAADGFSELSCPSCKHVHGIMHMEHRAMLIITGENGKRKWACPICGKPLRS